MKGAILTVLSAFAIMAESSAENSERLLEEFREGNREVPIVTDVYVSREILVYLGKGVRNPVQAVQQEASNYLSTLAQPALTKAKKSAKSGFC